MRARKQRGRARACHGRSRLGALRKHTKRGDPRAALRAQLINGQGIEHIEVADESLLEGRRHRHRISMCTAERLLENLIDETELTQPVGREPQGFGGRLFLVGAAPENRGAALG